MSDPKVSVIIPCYNLGAYIEEAVDSVEKQTFGDSELIIINDGSTDPHTLKTLSELDQRALKIIHTPNQGLPAARNTAISQCRGKYVCCLDADDCYAPDFLAHCVPVLENDQQEELGFVTTHFQVFGQRQAAGISSDFDPIKLAVKNCVHVASLFRKTCWQAVGGYPTNMSGYQDWSFWLSIVARGWRWALVREPLFLYRDRPESMVKTSDQKAASLKITLRENNRDFYDQNSEAIMRQYDHLLAWRKQRADHQPLLEALLQNYLKLRWEKLADAGIKTVALYGAGNHTHWLINHVLVPTGTGPEILRIVDDRPPQDKQIENIPIVAFQPGCFDGCQTVIMSTDVHQDAMQTRLEQYGLSREKIINLYENLPPGPFPKNF